MFIPNVFGSDNAISCSYDVGGKTINFGIYNSSSGESVISNFIVDGVSYSYYFNKISKMDNLSCPVVASVSFYGDGNNYYYIAKDNAEFNLIVAQGILNDNEGNIIGQVKEVASGSRINSIDYVHYDTMEIRESDGVSDDTRKQMDINIKAYAEGACTYEEKTAIAEFFNSNDYYSVSSFYGDNVFKVKDKYIKLSDECARIATDLYNSTVSLIHMLSDYVDGGGNVHTLNYLSLQSSFYAGQGALKTPWYDASSTENACDAISPDVRNVLNNFFDTYRTISVVLVIFMIYIDGMKTLNQKDDEKTKKWFSNTIKRMIVLVAVILLPLIINLVLDFINRYLADSYVYVNGECIKAITGG